MDGSDNSDNSERSDCSDCSDCSGRGTAADLEAAIRRAAQENVESSTARLFLPLAAVERLCGEHCLSPADVETASLALGIAPERYLRNFETYTLMEQVRFLRAHVALVGLGGLGGYVLELLCRAGVGNIRGADGDEFAPSNLNRQLYGTLRSLGGFKAAAAAARVAQINPATEFMPVAAYLNGQEMEQFCAGAQVCVDALGGLRDRPALARAAAAADIPLVTAAVAGQGGYVATVLPGQASPADFFGTDPASLAAAAENTMGTPAPAVATAAAILSAEVLAIVCGRGPQLAGSMLLFDLGQMSFEKVRL